MSTDETYKHWILEVLSRNRDMTIEKIHEECHRKISIPTMERLVIEMERGEGKLIDTIGEQTYNITTPGLALKEIFDKQMAEQDLQFNKTEKEYEMVHLEIRDLRRSS